MSHGKRPAFQFYPKDWRDDIALQSCLLAAQGLWINMMCVMHSGTPYGHFAVNGVAIPDHEAAKLLGVNLGEYRRLLKALEKKGVPGRTEAGVLYSRRMVRDERIRQLRATAGHAGGVASQGRFAQANLKQTGKQSAEQMVAAAAAEVVVLREDPREGGVGGRESAVRALIPPDARKAFDGLLRASHNPDALIGEIGMLTERVRGATWEHVGLALRDLVLAGPVRSPGLALRSFVQKAIQEGSESIRLPRAPVEDDFDAAIRSAQAKEASRAR